MSKVEQIEAEIAQLSATEIQAVSRWLTSFVQGRQSGPPLSVDTAWLLAQPLNPAAHSADRYVREERDSRD